MRGCLSCMLPRRAEATLLASRSRARDLALYGARGFAQVELSQWQLANPVPCKGEDGIGDGGGNGRCAGLAGAPHAMMLTSCVGASAIRTIS